MLIDQTPIQARIEVYRSAGWTPVMGALSDQDDWVVWSITFRRRRAFSQLVGVAPADLRAEINRTLETLTPVNQTA